MKSISALLAVLLVLSNVGTAQSSAEAGLPRMSKAELGMFIHDLLHDLPSWQNRLNDYRRDLHPEYSYDAIAEKAFSLVDSYIEHSTKLASRLEERETLSDDIDMLSSLDTLLSDLDSLNPHVCAEDEGILASSGYEIRSLSLGRTTNEIAKELGGYILKFNAHVLNRSTWADEALKELPAWDEGSAWKPQPRNATGWNALGKAQKLSYVQYYLDGYFHGVLEGGIAGAGFSQQSNVAAPKIDPAKLARLQTGIHDQIGTGKHPTKIGEIEWGITAFYGDPINQRVCWYDAFKFAAMSLNGDTPTQQELQAAREADTKNGCK